MATVKDLEEKLNQLEEQLKNNKPAARDDIIDLPDAKYTPTIPYVPKKKVTIELFRDDYRYKEPLFVGINGQTWLIKRGVPVEVDDYVADFIEQQKAEEARIMRRVDQEEKEYQENIAKLGS
jgi:hypothetical protein